MKWTHGLVLAVMLAAVAVGMVATAGQSQESNTAANAVRVGVYDSRLVALAYGRSAELMSRVAEMKRELKAAQKSGDEETVARLEAEGPALQDQMHKQVFGNAPIPELMERIAGELPAIAAEAGVDVIVRTWDIAWQRDGVEFVDVSVPMMMLFDPTEETLGMVDEVRATPPVPLEELEKHTD